MLVYTHIPRLDTNGRGVVQICSSLFVGLLPFRPFCALCIQIVRDDLNRKRMAQIRIAVVYRGCRGRVRARAALDAAELK